MSKRIATETLVKEEFHEIITTYILPLLETHGPLKETLLPTKYLNQSNHIIAPKNSKYIYFKPVLDVGQPPFCYRIEANRSLKVLRFLENAVRELLSVSEFNYHKPYSIKRYYGDKDNYLRSYKDKCFNIAFELGMCHYLCGKRSVNSSTLHALICKMIEWSERTYEGKNVPFGIVIDFDKKCDESAANYLEFLDNDASAVFTDGVFTGILLDSDGKIDSFITRQTEAKAGIFDRTMFAPFQFWDIVKHCDKNAFGVIAMENGEILLIKEHSVIFAKRGNKWIYYDWSIVYNALRPYMLTAFGEKEAEDCLKNLYCSMLDVAFSHTGGCLSIVIPTQIHQIDAMIKERIDHFDDSSLPLELPIEEIGRWKKRKAIKCLLCDSNHNIRSFYEIDQQLRKEMISLDGATVFGVTGTLYCVGSIVSVFGGSSGGGRTAAAKQLASLGVGIKISEDGYIEAWGIPYNSKENQFLSTDVVQLFSLK